MYKIRLVCEGPTDYDALGAFLDAHLRGADYELTILQPDGSLYGGDAGPHGGGWKGVRGWCRAVAQAGGPVALAALTPDTDLLIIHVDADIAYDSEIAAAHPCPPPEDTVQAVEATVLSWLGLATLPSKVALWVPSMSTEAWILRALFPTDRQSVPCAGLPVGATCVECLRDPASALLGRRPKLVQRKRSAPNRGEVIRKLRREYQAQRTKLAGAWTHLMADLWSATRLARHLREWIP
jgi:hypothetical protein